MRKVGPSTGGSERSGARARSGRVAVALSCLALASGHGGALAARLPTPAPPGCENPATADRITRVGDDSVGLGSGVDLRIADIRFAERDAVPGPLMAWVAGLAGTAVVVAASTPDRWAMRRGRIDLSGAEGGAGGAIDLAELLVAEGLAVVDAGEQDGLCRPDLLGIEAVARAGRRGLWREPGGMLVAADDTAALIARAGRFTIVEGRVLSVGERPQRTYLNFTRFGAGGFALTIPKRVWTALGRRGVTAESLRGRRVRVRGVADMWRTPTMEMVAPDMLERLDTSPGEAR